MRGRIQSKLTMGGPSWRHKGTILDRDSFNLINPSENHGTLSRLAKFISSNRWKVEEEKKGKGEGEE